jgi:hypothetical protein
VTGEYRVPSNLELAAEANVIVFGQVVGEVPAAEPREAALEVRPLAAIKGLMPGGTVLLPGMALRPPDGPRPDEAGDPLDFAAPHPDALTGACIRRVFPAGATVLFFLRREDGEWVPAGGPFSRWAEDVRGLESPWAQLAVLYAHAAQIAPDEREALLQDQLEALQARTDDATALAMVADIERAMTAPDFPRFAQRPPPPAPPAAADDLGELGARIDALAGDAAD